MGKKATGQNKNYYTNQRGVTTKHKLDRAKKRTKNLAKWIAKGVNKKGKKVLTLEERKVRADNRKAVRQSVRKARHTEWREEGYKNHSNQIRASKVKPKDDE